MLIKRAPDVYEKMQILGGMAEDDVLSQPQGGHSNGKWASGPGGPAATIAAHGGNYSYTNPGKRPVPGVYRAAMPNGKFINLMRVMFTDFCMMDCAYCPNSIYVPRKRFAFKVDELANAFMEMHRRHTVDGLFLSSGIAGSGSKTTERMIKVVEVIRRKHGFKGYVHLKVMPGAERQYVEAAHRLGTRLSVNIETPTAEMMRRISPHKDFQGGILDPMSWIHQLTQASSSGAVGQATQMVVGAADESDSDIFQRVDQLYGDWNLKRVYYAAFRPAAHTPMAEHPAVPPMREHRLYQMDWLKRIYRYSNEELDLAFDGGGFPAPGPGPQDGHRPGKPGYLSRGPEHRQPGATVKGSRLGPSAQRIGPASTTGAIMGVVRKRAWPFVSLPRPAPAHRQAAEGWTCLPDRNV